MRSRCARRYWRRLSASVRSFRVGLSSGASAGRRRARGRASGHSQGHSCHIDGVVVRSGGSRGGGIVPCRIGGVQRRVGGRVGKRRSVGGRSSGARGDVAHAALPLPARPSFSTTNADFTDADCSWLEGEDGLGVDEVCKEVSEALDRRASRGAYRCRRDHLLGAGIRLFEGSRARRRCG